MQLIAVRNRWPCRVSRAAPLVAVALAGVLPPPSLRSQMLAAPTVTLHVRRLSATVVDLRWESVPGSLGYAIYVSSPVGSGPVRLADQPIVATKFRDRLPAGASARYQLVAFLTDGRTLRSGIHRLAPWAPPRCVAASCSPPTSCAFDCPVILP